MIKSKIYRAILAESRVVEDAGQTLTYREKKEQWRKQAVKNNPKGIAANEEWKKKNNIKDVQVDPNFAENVSRLKPMNTDHKPLPQSPSPVASAKVGGRTFGNTPLSRLRKPSKFSGLKVETKGRMRGSSVMRTAMRNIPIKIRASETPFILFRLLEGPAKAASKAAPKKSPAKPAAKPAANKLPGKAAVMPTMQPPAPPQPNPAANPEVKLMRKKAKDAVTSGKVKHAAPEAKKPAIKWEKLMSVSAAKEKVEMNKKEFKKEHKHLFRVLKGGKKKELKKELHKQKKEFKEEVKESGNPVNKMAAKAVKVWQGGGIPMSSKVGKAAIDFKMGKQSRRFLRRNKRNKYPKDNHYNSNQ